ncbi:hypothetical protein VTI74DRAFT_7986 [Chaetomium olivicolor]
MRQFIATISLETEELAYRFIERFISAIWRALAARLAVTLRPSSAFHPQPNRHAKRNNAKLEQYLGLFVKFFKASEIAARFEAVLEVVTALKEQAQDRHEEIANRRHRDAPIYRAKNKVMLNMENVKTERPSQKLEPKWEGPFEVIKASSHTVTLRLPANTKIFNTLHVSKVRPYRGNEDIRGQEHTQRNVRANRGSVVTRTDDGEEIQEWGLEAILDYGKADSGKWQ